MNLLLSHLASQVANNHVSLGVSFLVASKREVKLRSLDNLVVHLFLTSLSLLLSVELEESIAECLLGDLVVLDSSLAEFVSARGEELEQIKVVEVLRQVSDVN